MHLDDQDNGTELNFIPLLISFHNHLQKKELRNTYMDNCERIIHV